MVLVWHTNEIATCATGKSMIYLAEPPVSQQFVVQECFRCDLYWYLWPEAEGVR